MGKYNMSANLVRTIQQLYDKATSAVHMNGSMGKWFRTIVGVRQRCLLSSTLFNIFSSPEPKAPGEHIVAWVT